MMRCILCPTAHAKAGIPKRTRGKYIFPNPRCVNLSNVSPSIITCIETTLYPPPPPPPHPPPPTGPRRPAPPPPPRAPPNPYPRCVLANPVQPPTPWKRGCRTCGQRTALSHEAHWAKHPRDILADGYTRCVATCIRALCCRKTMSQSCLSQLWFSNIQPYGQKSPTAKASLPTRRTISTDT
jgi:hypothetical protein